MTLKFFANLISKSRRFILISIIGFIFSTIVIFTQEKPKKRKIPSTRNYMVTKAISGIKINGVLDEDAWKEAEVISLPFEWWPGDNIQAPVKTECLMTFSKTKLYIGFRCYDPEPKKIRAHLMDRDLVTTFIQDDYVFILIDSFNDQRRGFQFMINSLGVQADAIYSEAERFEDFAWDAIWDSAGKITDFGYTVEIAIPFNQLRFPNIKGKQTWGFSIQRSYPRNVRHRITSHPIDRNMDFFLPLINKITGFENVSPGRNLEFDPTLTGSRTDERDDFPQGEMEAGKLKVEPGITAHWGITSNLILNATVNPDFSHVEADAAQLDVNTRFALYYSEKRPFFLEGSDFFLTPFEVVFTRTIVDPHWGVKLTGKAGKNVIGIFSTQDRYNNLLFPSNQGSWSTLLDEDVFGGVIRYRRDVGKSSRIGFLYTGRAGEHYYNHVVGVDGFMRLSQRKSISFQVLRSQTDYSESISKDFGQPEDSFGGNAVFTSFRHAGRNLWYGFSYEDLSPNFRADSGFIHRVDLRKVSGFVEPIIWGTKGGWFDKLTFKMTGEVIYDYHGNLTDSVLEFSPTYTGPLQTFIWPEFKILKESYNGITYDLKRMRIHSEMKPIGGLEYFFYIKFGDAIDYVNSRKARLFIIYPGIGLGIGNRLNLNLNHTYERLSLDKEKIYTANLLQAQLVYHFNVRTLLRIIFQFTDISRNLNVYTIPVEPRTKDLFLQFLFSYKINPQTVLFLGYSDNHCGWKDINLTRKSRTFFLKIGYALGL